MHEATGTKTLSDYVAVLAAHKWLIVIVTLIAIGAGVAYSTLTDPTYDATATIAFQNESTDISVLTPGVQVAPDVNPTQSAAANSRLVTREDVVDAVQSKVNTGMTDDELRSAVSATVQPDSDLVAIIASAGNAQLAARIANEFALRTKTIDSRITRRQFGQDADRLKETLKAEKDPSTAQAYAEAIARLRVLSQVADPVTITRPATVPDSATTPRPARDITVAAILGLLVGLGAAFLRNALDRRLSDGHEAERELGLPLVGYVRAETLGLAGGALNGDAPAHDEELETFRILRTNVNFLAPDLDVSTLVVTSAVAEEGKSTVAAGYAYVSATAGRRTLLVDCDLRKPVLADRFAVAAKPGLAEVLGGDAELQDALRAIDVQGAEPVPPLTLIPAGGTILRPAEMIGSQRFRRFVDQVKHDYDLVIFDSAPLLPVSDTLEMIPILDAGLLCVRIDQTTRHQAQAASESLHRLPDKPIGLVITGVKRGGDDDYYGYAYPGGPLAKSRAAGSD
jgi:succinoglycan biosynthesis transport protein ExoP